MERFDDLDDVLRSCWNLLYKGAVQTKDDFHTPVLATTNGQTPNARTVVLRETIPAERKLVAYSDIRSGKIEDIEQYPHACWVFWNPSKHIQIRATGKVTIHHKNELAAEKWAKITPAKRRDYATAKAPGHSKQFAENDLSPFWNNTVLNSDTTNMFFEHFVVLSTEVEEIDWLHLHREGHQRAKFYWVNLEWQKMWAVP